MADTPHSSLAGGELHDNKDHALAEHTDVDSAPPDDGMMLVWVDDDSRWAGAHPTVARLADVDLSTPPSDGDYLRWDAASGTWKPSAT